MQTEVGITKNLTLSVLPKAPQHISNRTKKLSVEHSAINSGLVLVEIVSSSWSCEVTLKILSWPAFLVVLFCVNSSGNRSHPAMWTSISFDLLAQSWCVRLLSWMARAGSLLALRRCRGECSSDLELGLHPLLDKTLLAIGESWQNVPTAFCVLGN